MNKWQLRLLYVVLWAVMFQLFLSNSKGDVDVATGALYLALTGIPLLFAIGSELRSGREARVSVPPALEPEEAAPALQVDVGVASGPARCPYCRDGLDHTSLSCAECSVAHHTACLIEARGCSTLGCVNVAPRSRLRA